MSGCIEVTGENFAEFLFQSVREAVAFKEGRLEPERVSRYEIIV